VVLAGLFMSAVLLWRRRERPSDLSSQQALWAPLLTHEPGGGATLWKEGLCLYSAAAHLSIDLSGSEESAKRKSD